VENMLTREPQQDAKLSAGIRINGARIVENINLENVKLICAIRITDSRIEGAYDKTLAYGTLYVNRVFAEQNDWMGLFNGATGIARRK
jgi:hypothetical protein